MRETKRYFAPVPNRALVDDRIHGLHFRFFGVVAAHDRFGQNGLGSTLSLQRYADILGSHKQSIARVRRELIDWATGRCRIHGGKSPGARVGNSNARKHGRYTAEAIDERRKLAALIRTMKSLATDIEQQD